MTEIAIGEFEIVADASPQDRPRPAVAVEATVADLDAQDLALVERELLQRALRIWAD